MGCSRGNGLIGGFIIWIVIFYYIQKWFGWAWLLGIISTIIFIIFILIHFDKIRTKREQEAREKDRCKHGIVGANQNPRLCSICLEEGQQREEERIRQTALRKQQAEEQRRQIDWWKSLDGRQFEKELNNFLREKGYHTTLTPYSADGGVDIIIREGERKIIVQCKAHSNYISPNVVRDLYGTMIHEKADEGWLVTTSGFYSGAREFAQGKPIKLLTIKRLLQGPAL
jgi:restriction endonuclease Mrr